MTEEQCEILEANFHWCDQAKAYIVEQACGKMHTDLDIIKVLYESSLKVRVKNLPMHV